MKLVTVLAAALLLAAPAKAEVQPASSLAGSCAACHGPDGEGSGAIPKIKDRPAEILLNLLVGFAEGREQSTIMGRLAKGYTPEQLRLLADHFGAK